MPCPSFLCLFQSASLQKIAALKLVEPTSEHDVDIIRRADLGGAEKKITNIKLNDINMACHLSIWSFGLSGIFLVIPNS